MTQQAKIFAIIALALAVLQPAFPAAPGPDGNRGHLYRLLHNTTVLEHLDFSVQQKKRAQEIVAGVVEQHREAFEVAMRPPTKAERVPLVRKVFLSITADVFRQLKDILEEAQFRRLKQIELQLFGLRGFQRPEIIAALQMTPEQAQAVQVVANEAGKQLSMLHRHEAPLAEGEKRVTRASIKAEGLAQVRELLTPLQWIRWELLVGARFND